MSTQTHYFKGKVAWCRPDTINEWGKFSTRFYPIPEDVVKIKSFGAKNEWHMDQEGEYTNISAVKDREFRGIKQTHHITIVDKEGKPLKDKIGDGSDVVLKAEVYTHPIKGSSRRGTAIKWMGLQVLNLVPAYVPPEVPEGEQIPF